MDKIKKSRVASFLKAMWTFVANGCEYLPKEKIEARFEICSACDRFNGHVCSSCGCCGSRQQTLFNKLAHPAESCPEGHWDAERLENDRS